MQHLAGQHRLGTAVKHGWFRLINAARPRERVAPRRPGFFAPLRAEPRRPEAPDPAPLPGIDPVLLTIMAVNRLGPATVRSAANGKAVTITVADERVGEIFRAALAEMQKMRVTDRLIDVVVSGEARSSAEAAERRL
jgi:hypothetical protein